MPRGSSCRPTAIDDKQLPRVQISSLMTQRDHTPVVMARKGWQTKGGPGAGGDGVSD
jgi:hypothetical protein